MMRRIALTTITLRNTVCPQLVGAAGASPILKRLPTTQNAVSPPSANLRVRDEERPSNRFARPRGLPASPRRTP